LDEDYDEQLVICEDEFENVQAMAIMDVNSDSIGLCALATHPNNIPAYVNAEVTDKVRGAGTAIISHLAKYCSDEGKRTILLSTYKSGRPFYEKMGFEDAGEQEFNDQWPMKKDLYKRSRLN
jgi:GNAT superfamily N-acetyltransferase